MNTLFLSNVPVCCRSRLLPRNLVLPRLWKWKASRVPGRPLGIPRCSIGVALGGDSSGGYDFENVPKFPRINVWDPYKRLGVTSDASEEEILEARDFLLKQYAGYEMEIPNVKPFKIQAILDTGATVCCIDQESIPADALEPSAYPIQIEQF